MSRLERKFLKRQKDERWKRLEKKYGKKKALARLRDKDDHEFFWETFFTISGESEEWIEAHRPFTINAE
jgi:hypothetical protein